MSRLDSASPPHLRRVTLGRKEFNSRRDRNRRPILASSKFLCTGAEMDRRSANTEVDAKFPAETAENSGPMWLTRSPRYLGRIPVDLAVMRRLRWIVIATTCCALAADQAFEVASIRTRTDGTGDIWTIKRVRFDVSGPSVLIENFRLSDLIIYAYDIKDYQLF